MPKRFKPQTRARWLAERTKKAAVDLGNAGRYFDRVFESWLEEGDGDMVVLAFLEIYDRDEDLVEAVERVLSFHCPEAIEPKDADKLVENAVAVGIPKQNAVETLSRLIRDMEVADAEDH